jgi:hypothetical protein
MAQEIFEFWMPGQYHRERITLLTHQFHQALQFTQRFPVEIMRFIDKQRNRLAAFTDQVQQLPFSLFGLRGDLHVFLGRQVVEQGHDQGPQIDPVLIHRKGPRHEDFLFPYQLRLHALEEGRFATADDPRHGHQLALGDGGLELQIELLILVRFKKPRLADIAA